MKFEYPLGPKSRGMNERCIEYPWALNRLVPGCSVLDVGTVSPPLMSGHEQYYYHVKRTLRCRYVTLDIMPGADITGDISDVSLSDDSFDFVVALSTLEHIFSVDAALENMSRIGKYVLLTLPFGFPHSMSWGKNYGIKDLVWLLPQGKYEVLEQEFFEYRDGWESSDPESLSTRTYYSCGASDAAGIVCLTIRRCDGQVVSEEG